jgi:hypothetical protein
LSLLEAKRVASSISSSEQFPAIKHWLGIWVFVAVALLCFTVFVSSSHFSWFFDPTSGDKRLEAVRTQAIAPRANARIIILGNSRAAFGLVPSIIEHVLERPALDVANWAYPAFELEAYEILVNANKDKIAAADVVILTIDPYFMLVPIRSAPSAEIAPAAEWSWTRMASLMRWLGTRNWAIELDGKLRELVGAIARISNKMAWFLHELGGHLGLVNPYRLNWAMLPTGNWDVGMRDFTNTDIDPGVQSVRIAEIYYKDREISHQQVRNWRRFVRSLTAIARQVALVYLPSSRSFVAAERPYADLVEQNRKVFQGFAAENRIPLVEMTSAECDLTEPMFQDPVHVNRMGREILSECFAQRLQQVLW